MVLFKSAGLQFLAITFTFFNGAIGQSSINTSPCDITFIPVPGPTVTVSLGEAASYPPITLTTAITVKETHFETYTVAIPTSESVKGAVSATGPFYYCTESDSTVWFHGSTTVGHSLLSALTTGPIPPLPTYPIVVTLHPIQSQITTIYRTVTVAPSQAPITPSIEAYSSTTLQSLVSPVESTLSKPTKTVYRTLGRASAQSTSTDVTTTVHLTSTVTIHQTLTSTASVSYRSTVASTITSLGPVGRSSTQSSIFTPSFSTVSDFLPSSSPSTSGSGEYSSLGSGSMTSSVFTPSFSTISDFRSSTYEISNSSRGAHLTTTATSKAVNPSFSSLSYFVPSSSAGPKSSVGSSSASPIVPSTAVSYQFSTSSTAAFTPSFSTVSTFSPSLSTTSSRSSLISPFKLSTRTSYGHFTSSTSAFIPSFSTVSDFVPSFTVSSISSIRPISKSESESPVATSHSLSTLSTVTSSSKTSSAATSTPSECGEYGNFTLNWDDEPAFTPTDNDTAPYPPVFNPYHQLFFSNGYAYAPPPAAPFVPVSPPRMAVFLPNDTENINSPYAGLSKPGEISAGPRAYINAFWFNAYAAYLGCDDGGPEGCQMDITGYKWDASIKKEILATRHVVNLPACPGLEDCRMTLVDFVGDFAGLSGVRVHASVNGQPRIFFMDNLSMGWYNNTCAAGLYRLSNSM